MGPMGNDGHNVTVGKDPIVRSQQSTKGIGWHPPFGAFFLFSLLFLCGLKFICYLCTRKLMEEISH